MLKFEWTKKHTTLLIYSCCTILLALAIVFAFLFPSVISGFIKDFFTAVSPVFFGFVIAYLVNPVCDFFDKKVFKKRIASKKAARALAVACSMLVVLAIIAAFLGIMVPQIASSYASLESKFEGYVVKVTGWVRDFVTEMQEDGNELFLSLFNTQKLLDSVDDMLGTAFGFLGGFANTLLTYSSKIIVIVAKAVVSFIFAMYFLFEKELIFSGISKISDAIFSDRFNLGARRWLSYTDEVFSSFISGKIVNALFITAINFVVFGLFKIPYYPLVALICGVTDMIPYFGPFIGAVPCAFIILIADPIKVLWFAALVLVIQQIDGNIVGPKILGEKVGVDSLLIIVAITIGGGLFGVAGMFVGVPVFTVIYHAFNEIVCGRLKKKGLPTDTASYKVKKGAAK